MDNEALEILKALKHGVEVLNAKFDNFDIRLSRVEGLLTAVEERLAGLESEVGVMRETLELQDETIDILSSKSIRLQAKVNMLSQDQ